MILIDHVTLHKGFYSGASVRVCSPSEEKGTFFICVHNNSNMYSQCTTDT